jgi:hypothetical protein
MADRVFGPIRGAGVQLTERRGQQAIIQGALGTTVMMGVLERGEEGDINAIPSSRALIRKVGKLLDQADFGIPDFASLDAPLNAEHFWQHSEGAGQLFLLRVVPTTNDATNDDRPAKAEHAIWNREDIPKRVGTLYAKNGGAWAGKRKVHLGMLEGVPANDFPAANQIQLYDTANSQPVQNLAMQRDEWRNAEVTLAGLPGYSYRVVENTSAGLLTLEADADVASDWGAGETPGSETGTETETFNLETVLAAWTIGVTTDVGGPDTATLTATAGSLGGDGAGTFPITQTGSMFIVVNGTEYEVALTAGQTEAQVIDAIEAAIPGIDVVSVASTITINTDRKGTGATITLNDSASTTALVSEVFSTATPTETTGTGDVYDSLAATAAEIKTALDTAIGGGTSTAIVTENAGGSLTVESPTQGSSSTVQMSGNLLALLGFDGAVHTGTDGPTDLEVTMIRENQNVRGQTKVLSYEFRNGGLKPATEFGVIFKVDGEVYLNYENLSFRSDQSNYWVDVINSDPNNDIVEVEDTFAGDRTVGTARPANHYGLSEGLTFTRLTIADPTIVDTTVAGDWVPSLSWGSWGSDARHQRLRVDMTSASAFDVTTDQGERVASGTLTNPVDMGDQVGVFTISTGSGTPQAGDWFHIWLNPLTPDECIGGKVNPNTANSKMFNIVDNGVDYVDVSDSEDLTVSGSNSAGDPYRIEYPQQMERGYDGYVKGMVEADYTGLLDPNTSPLRKIFGQNLGVVKMGIPGIAKEGTATKSVALQQTARDLCLSYNWGYRAEFPATYHDWDVYDEFDLVDFVEDQLGRLDLSSVFFPSFGYIRHPLAPADSDAGEFLCPTLGMHLGREARTAREYQGYHKAPAGIDVTFPLIIRMPVIGRAEAPERIDEEVLNPAGINVYRWTPGGAVLIAWGDRTLDDSTAFQFYHKRMLLSQYEHDLQEGFDFAIFQINDPISDQRVLAKLYDYFLPEWRKRAIRGDTFIGGKNPAAIFKMDAENNTDATRAQGDQIVEISLRLADVTERLRIFIGQMGVTEGA